MPLLTYRQRVQSVLSNLARDNRTSIDLDALLGQVWSSMERDGVSPGPRYASHVKGALQQEARARRIVVEKGSSMSVVALSQCGRQFYLHHGPRSLLDLGDIDFKRQSTSQIHRDISSLQEIISEIRCAFLEFHCNYWPSEANDDLPTLTEKLLRTIDDLEHANNELHLALYMER